MREKTLQCILNFHNTVDALQDGEAQGKEGLARKADSFRDFCRLRTCLGTAFGEQGKHLAACKEIGLELSAVHEILFKSFEFSFVTFGFLWNFLYRNLL